MLPFAVLGVFAFLLILYRFRRPPKPAGELDRQLFAWTDGTRFDLRDALRSISIMGAAGSGKSSGSGLHFAKALFGIPNSGGLILASKPEDVSFWQKIAKQAGREHDLILFGPKHAARMNYLGLLKVELKGDSRDQTHFLTVMSESMNRGQGKSSEPFWEAMREITLHHAIELLNQAYGEVTTVSIKDFIINAPISADQIKDEKWQDGFHYKTLLRCFAKPKDEVQQGDYEQGYNYFITEWSAMDNKVRSSILAEINTVLHAANTGVTRLLTSTTTTISPADMAKGKWILADASIREHGESGRYTQTGAKFVAERFILARHAKEGDGPIFIWADEYQNVVNSFDATFLAECRSHRGAMTVLTQSLHSYYANMDGEKGRAFADALLSNFGTKVFHLLGDAKSAEYASSLLGKDLEIIINTNEGDDAGIYDQIMGRSQFRSSFNRSYQPVLQPSAFMSCLRTGGNVHKLMTDAIVITSEGFKGGQRWLKVPFSQQF